MKEEKEILKDAIAAFKRETGLEAEYQLLATNLGTPDFEIRITEPDGPTAHYYGEIKARLSNAIIGRIAAHSMPRDLILVSQYVAAPQAKKLRSLGIGFIDTVGNAYLKSRGLHVFVTGKRSEVPKDKPVGIFRPAGIRLILALLTAHGLENADYRTISADTGIARTTIGELMADLERSGYLVNRPNKRFLQRKEELIRRWAEAYAEKFRIKLDPQRFKSTKKTGRWWEEINLSDYNAVWGGETGGAELTRHLRPKIATIYADTYLPRLQLKYGLERDPQGEIEILKRFWKFGEARTVAPPLVVYADLLATADERNVETAKLIYDEYLAQIATENS